MRFRLRTLLIVLAVGPPMLWGGYSARVRYVEWRERQDAIDEISTLSFAPKGYVIRRAKLSGIWPKGTTPPASDLSAP